MGEVHEVEKATNKNNNERKDNESKSNTNPHFTVGEKEDNKLSKVLNDKKMNESLMNGPTVKALSICSDSESDNSDGITIINQTQSQKIHHQTSYKSPIKKPLL